MIGPEADDQSWKKTVQKYFDNARMWGNLGLGLHYSTMAYLIYIFPILSFVAQLQNPPVWVLEAEEKALRLIIPGPYRWILKDDLFHLSECYGQKISLPSLAHVCSAAQKRVYTLEHIQKGGLRIHNKQEELTQCMRRSDHLNRMHRWGSWFQNGPVATLFNNSKTLDEIGLNTNCIIDIAAGGLKEEESGMQRLMRIRPKFQKTIRKELVKRTWVDPIARMRRKLERFQLGGLPGTTANRMVRVLQMLQSSVNPKVVAAVLRTIWNGWTSEHRFQGSGTCVFNCKHWTENRVEHYAVCPYVIQFGRKVLNIHPPPSTNPAGLFLTLGLHEATVTDTDIIRRAIWVYATYRAVMELSHDEDSDDGEPLGNAQELLKQFAKEAVEGHGPSTAILDSCFLRRPTQRNGILEDALDDWNEDI